MGETATGLAPSVTPDEARCRRHELYRLLIEIGRRARRVRLQREAEANGAPTLAGISAPSALDAVQTLDGTPGWLP
jgi:hypothetical protein